MESGKTKITHVIFDMDGLLLDTEELYTKAYQTVLKEYGHEYTFEFKITLMGNGPQEAAQKVVEHFGLPISASEFLEKLAVVQKKLFPKSKVLPGMDKLVHHLYKHKIPIAVATSSGDEAFQLKTEHHATLFGMFNHIVRRSDPQVQRSKPFPDIFNVCAQRFFNPDDGVNDFSTVLVFEDSPAGVEAAHAAGMKVAMIPDKRIPSSLTEKADYVFKSAHDFDPTAFGLPPYSYHDVTHVIFDLDGTLLDTVEVGYEAMGKALSRCGKEFDLEFHRSLAGQRTIETLPEVVANYGLEVTVDELEELYLEEVTELLQDIPLLEGVTRLVYHLYKKKVPMAVATSSSTTTFKLKLDDHRDLLKMMHHYVTGDDPEVESGKPAPDIFQICARRFDDNVDMSKCLVFEDSFAGIQSATSAGMQCVMIPFGNETLPDLTTDATQHLSTLRNFRPQDFGLPPYPKSD